MADNAEINAGSGTVVATDEAPGGEHYQKIKIVDGTADSTTVVPADGTKGLRVDPRGSTTLVSATPTISTSQYTAKDAIGGVMTFSSAARVSGAGGIVESVVIVDKDQELAAMDLVLLSATVAGTTTDNAAWDPNDSDLANVVGVIPILTGDYSDFNDNSVAARSGIGMAYTCAATSLFGVLVARGTPTYTGTSDISVILGLLPD